MRSRYADKFNHDEDADDYDRDVLDESHPVREGYDALLNWVAQRSTQYPHRALLELGVGSGNLSLRLPAFDSLLAVDVSAKMLALAQKKLAARTGVDYAQTDLLQFFDTQRFGREAQFDQVLSTYAIHHLTEDEKPVLFKAIKQVLRPRGVALFGDLMFADAEAGLRYLSQCRQQQMRDFADDIEDEFFWNLSSARAQLEALGFTLRCKQFSPLSWGVEASLASLA